METIGSIDNTFKKLAIEIRYDLLPRYKRLARCIDEYRANPTPSTAEHVILAFQGDERLTAGPTEIADLRSHFMHQKGQRVYDETKTQEPHTVSPSC